MTALIDIERSKFKSGSTDKDTKDHDNGHGLLHSLFPGQKDRYDKAESDDEHAKISQSRAKQIQCRKRKNGQRDE